MPRDIPIGNGSLLITFDQDYRLRDLYYPHVGKENHTDGHPFRFGLWVGGAFAWVGRDWNPRCEYVRAQLVTDVRLEKASLGVGLHCTDLVDHRENLYLKKIVVHNGSERPREFRLFFHHDFHILESPAGDTAYYDPDEQALIHYNQNRYFLTSGIRNGQPGLDQYATGVKEFHGLEGTWRDAEDGWLDGSPIAQGSVDSCLSFWVRIAAGAEQTLYYWIAAGTNYAEVSSLNKSILGHGPEYYVRRTANYWSAWVHRRELPLAGIGDSLAGLYTKSLLILRTNIDAGGAIIAGNDSDIQQFARDTYSYMWPRDGAFAAYALDKAGYHGVTRDYYDFCSRIVARGKESSGYFLHKYNPDGSLGSSWHPWVNGQERLLPIQEDSTALVLWALWSHFERTRDVEFAMRLYDGLVIRCGDFLASYRDSTTGLPLPSYDLWEEGWGIHTFTVATVYAGIRAAEQFARVFGDARRIKIYQGAAESVRRAMAAHLYSREERRFVKCVVPGKDGALMADTTVDASIYAPFYFGVFAPDDEMVVRSMEAVKSRLWVRSGVGGIARYEADSYQRAPEADASVPGNPWFICTLWLAQWVIARARNREELHEALPILEWVASRALPSGVLAEQVHPYTNQPLSVSPLTWSHAAFVTTVLEYLEKPGRGDFTANRRVRT
jgi:GH15 family glucan-1,4-alpha-glucosidase